MNKKEFKVVKILDEYNLIINAGRGHGIELNDEFQILDKKGSKVVDPDTNEVIGRLDLVKATVEVTELHEKMCICSSRKVINNNSPFANMALASPLTSISEAITPTEQEKLNVDLTQITGGKRKSNRKIKIGDTVKLLKSGK